MAQLTLDPEPKAIPISKNRKPLSTKEKKVWNVLKNSPFPRTRKELQKIDALDDVGDIGRTLRTLKDFGWIRRIPDDPRAHNPKWEAIR